MEQEQQPKRAPKRKPVCNPEDRNELLPSKSLSPDLNICGNEFLG